jgi:restriction system protein
MGRRNDGGLIGGILDELVKISRAWPPAGFIIGIAFWITAAYLKWINPKAIYGAAPIFSFLALGFGFVFIGAGIVGLITRKQRTTRLLAQRTLDDVKRLTWKQFEELIADMYRRQGYRVEETGAPGDGGIDLILRDRHGAEHLVQCKQYRSWKVGAPNIRDFYGAMAARQTRCEGIFITCGQFTADARAFAAGKPIHLIDGNELMPLLASVNPVTPSVKTYTTPLPPPIIQTSIQPPLCPKCRVTMVRRIAKKGANAGRPFWGCASYPNCQAIVNIAEH